MAGTQPDLEVKIPDLEVKQDDRAQSEEVVDCADEVTLYESESSSTYSYSEFEEENEDEKPLESVVQRKQPPLESLRKNRNARLVKAIRSQGLIPPLVSSQAVSCMILRICKM